MRCIITNQLKDYNNLNGYWRERNKKEVYEK